MRLIIYLTIIAISTPVLGNEICNDIFNLSKKISKIKSQRNYYLNLKEPYENLIDLALNKEISLFEKLKIANDIFAKKASMFLLALKEEYYINRYLKYIKIYLLDQGWKDFIMENNDGSFYLDFKDNKNKSFPNNPMGQYIRRLLNKALVNQIHFTAKKTSTLGFYEIKLKNISLSHEDAINEFILNENNQSSLLITFNHEFRHAIYYSITETNVTSLSLELRSQEKRKIPVMGYTNFLSIQEIYTQSKDIQALLGFKKKFKAEEKLTRVMDILSVFNQNELRLINYEEVMDEDNLVVFRVRDFLKDIDLVIRPLKDKKNKMFYIKKINRILLRLKKLSDSCHILWQEYLVTKDPNIMRKIIQTINASLEDELKEPL